MDTIKETNIKSFYQASTSSSSSNPVHPISVPTVSTFCTLCTDPWWNWVSSSIMDRYIRYRKYLQLVLRTGVDDEELVDAWWKLFIFVSSSRDLFLWLYPFLRNIFSFTFGYFYFVRQYYMFILINLIDLFKFYLTIFDDIIELFIQHFLSNCYVIP